MGGAVNIAVRTNTGKVYCRSSYTGWINYFFDNTRFLDEEPTHLEDFLKNNPDEMGLYPDGYGLVLGDMVSKTILTSQGYTAVGKIYGSSIVLSAEGCVIGEDDGQSLVDIFNEAHLAKRIDRVEYRIRSNMSKLELLDITNMDPGDIYNFFKKFRDADDMPFWEVFLDTTPYTIEDFGEGRSALEDMRKRIIELDFKLSEEDNEGWEEHASYYEEDDDFEDDDEEYEDD